MLLTLTLDNVILFVSISTVIILTVEAWLRPEPKPIERREPTLRLPE